ncbi:hypothetical protein SAMN05192551_107115 [Tindallia magadiensis]|uniref:Uncharacterized protein n=1 Tax=Tindallia magadiensis TaxID=69895 RepID=A0A1I3FZ45_9FIRM|nr:hypothetical protein [Tindallia magadiensis]SFI16486.1 hypothetical protein SAMN05192551_107115 [Tindallia magadiensis]
MNKLSQHPSFHLIIVVLLSINTLFSLHLFTSNKSLQEDHSYQLNALTNLTEQIEQDKKQLYEITDSLQQDLQKSHEIYKELEEESSALKEENEQLKKKLL